VRSYEHIPGIRKPPMLDQEQVDTLAALPIFEPVPRSELEWMLARGRIERFPAGTMLREAGTAVDEMWIIIDGRVAVYFRKGGAGGGSLRKFYESVRGAAVGAVPYSRLFVAPARVIVEDDTTVFLLNRDHFPDLIRECPELTAALVHQMVDRARDWRTAQIHDERMQSLGRLAAGLAHELNNPASGASSHARSLTRLLDEVQSAAKALANAKLTPEQLEAIDAVRRTCTQAAQGRTSLEVADREDEFSEWLEAHHIDPLPASTLAVSNIGVDALRHLASVLTTEALHAAILWVASDTAVRQAATHITVATKRIHDLVGAMKGFTFMDRDGVPEAVDIARGLANTVAVLESKSRAKSLTVRIETATDLPTVHAFGSELNQVWEKLIDNAIDAARVEGSVTVTATKRGDSVVVRVADDGPGIPDEHRGRIFDPFFTTKAVGAGTGLGLDIARRFVDLNNGDLDFTSQPGHTVFRVRLPIAGATA
jgi:signal transduction histidine kinase